VSEQLAYAAGVRDISSVRGLRGALVRIAQRLIEWLMRDMPAPIVMVAELPDQAPLPTMDVFYGRLAAPPDERPRLEKNEFTLAYYQHKRSIKYLARRGRRYAGDVR